MSAAMEAPASPIGAWRDIIYFLRFLIPYLDKQLVLVLLLFTGALLGLVNPLITKVLLDVVYPTRDITVLKFVILLWIFVYVMNAVSGWVEELLGSYLTLRVQFDLRRAYFDKLHGMSYEQFCRREPQGYFYGATKDIDTIVGLLRTTVPAMLQSLLNFSLLLVLVFWLNWKLTLFSLAIIPFIQVTTQLSSKRLQQLEARRREKDSEYLQACQENVGAFKVIKQMYSQRHERQKVARRVIDVFRLEMSKSRVRGLFTTSQGFLQSFWAFALTWYGWMEVFRGNLSIGELMAVTMYLFQLHGPIRSTAVLYQQAKMQSVACAKVAAVLQTRGSNGRAAIERRPALPARGELQFDRVSFEYHGRSILRGVSLTVPAGSRTAIVGPNGAGKTTLISLGVRLLTPSAGDVYLDGVRASDIHPRDYSRLVGIVPQESFIFSGTVRENIVYNRRDVSNAEIDALVDLVCARDMVAALPQGLATPLVSNRVALSGGERQKIQLMRALLRRPRLLVLDEATSEVDAKSEQALFHNLHAAYPDVTLLIVSHRLTAVQDADVIYVIEDGRLAEAGRHDDLVSQRGSYFRLNWRAEWV